MSREIRIYVEGGGDQRETVQAMRRGFNGFLRDLKAGIRGKARWKLVPCGSRGEAFSGFGNAVKQYPEAFNILLVDSEKPVMKSARAHLEERDGWDLSNVDEKQCHMMVQVMESWFLADPEALQAYYGQGFHAGSIPQSANVEVIEKCIVLGSLCDATRNTRTKGKYHKTRHAPDILEMMDPNKVRKAAPHCDGLFRVLEDYLS